MNLKRRQLFALASILALPQLAFADQKQKMYRMGCLWGGSPGTSGDLVAILMKCINNLGYVEGKNLSISTRWAESKEERFPALAAELVALQPDVIVVSAATLAIKAAQQATKKIPIVMLGSPDPVSQGFVASLAHPGGNITGMSSMAFQMPAKQLEVLHTTLPKASRIGVLTCSDIAPFSKDLKEAATRFGISLFTSMIQTPDEFEQGIAVLTRQKVDAVIVIPHNHFLFHRKRLSELMLAAKLPTIYANGTNPDAGGMLGYGPGYPHLFKLSASYIDKILRGAKPADLPVQQPTEFELVVNLKTAKALGIAIPPAIMVRADRVIE